MTSAFIKALCYLVGVCKAGMFTFSGVLPELPVLISLKNTCIVASISEFWLTFKSCVRLNDFDLYLSVMQRISLAIFSRIILTLSLSYVTLSWFLRVSQIWLSPLTGKRKEKKLIGL